MRSGSELLQALAIGAGITIILSLLLMMYLRLGTQIRTWIANIKMKSLFFRDRRRRDKGRTTR
ncbi:MAG: hypothetical protein KAH97_05040 [Anaerolineales bacterium]|jgi:hypothetical protein|nr:hypothetical protein [Anaerolineales bacterium]